MIFKNARVFLKNRFETCDVAVENGVISAIGPAAGVFIVMVGLMASIGGPMSWLRLSIIGAAATELSAATFGAQAAGVPMGGEGYTLTITENAIDIAGYGQRGLLYGVITLEQLCVAVMVHMGMDIHSTLKVVGGKRNIKVLVDYLLEHESITGEQFEALMEGREIEASSTTSMFDRFQVEEEPAQEPVAEETSEAEETTEE